MRSTQYTNLRTVDFVRGRAAPGVEWTRGVKTHALLISLILTATLGAVGGGAAITAEGLLRLLTRLRILESGTPTIDINGRILGYLASRDQYLPAVVGVLPSLVAGTYNIRADLALRFASLVGGDPSETAYVELNPNTPTVVEYEFSGDPGADLVAGAAAGTVTVDAMRVETTQVFDTQGEMPFYLPRITRTQSAPIVGVQPNFALQIVPERATRVESILLHSQRNGATVDDLFTGPITIRGDRMRYVDGVDYRRILAESRATFLGIQAPRAGYLEPFFSRRYGQLSRLYHPGQDTNLRVEAAVANGGGGDAVIDAYIIGREPVPGFTKDLPSPTW